MSTAAKLDLKAASGFKGVKDAMKQLSTNIKELEEKTAQFEEDKMKAKVNYAKAHAQQQKISDRRLAIEENLVKNDQKCKELKRRIEEKERFLEESKKFHKTLIVASPEEGKVEGEAARLKHYKDLYTQNYERYQKARNLKIELEQQVEQIETRSQDCKRTLNALETKLEYNNLEERRREQGCKTAIDRAFKAEKRFLELQKGLDGIMKRKQIATQRINNLESKIEKTETTYETINHERKKMETTIKELLLNIRNQKKGE